MLPERHCASKFDEKTGELKDEATRNFIKQQLASFAAFIPRVAGKSCKRLSDDLRPRARANLMSHSAAATSCTAAVSTNQT
jgi:hypothetical protein